MASRWSRPGGRVLVVLPVGGGEGDEFVCSGSSANLEEPRWPGGVIFAEHRVPEPLGPRLAGGQDLVTGGTPPTTLCRASGLCSCPPARSASAKVRNPRVCRAGGEAETGPAMGGGGRALPVDVDAPGPGGFGEHPTAASLAPGPARQGPASRRHSARAAAVGGQDVPTARPLQTNVGVGGPGRSDERLETDPGP